MTYSDWLMDARRAVVYAETAEFRALYGEEQTPRTKITRNIWAWEAALEARGEWLRAVVFLLAWVYGEGE